MPNRTEEWLRDPLLRRMHEAVRAAGPIRSISVDLTHVCNLRCEGCYYFSEGMDETPMGDAAALRAFVEREQQRGTNFVTIVGGEPSLELERLRILYDAFKLSVATNGVRAIPREGLEDLPIGVAVWGDHETDQVLRGGGRQPVFAKALRNYRDDPRAFFYYTVAPGHAAEVDSVVEQCVQNGNRVLFNFYGDLEHRGGDLDYRRGFGPVRQAVERAIERHPDQILMTSRLARIITTGKLFGDRWGHEVCTSISPDHVSNGERIQNGKAYNRHFRSYNADLVSTRRCCTAVDRDCSSCFDTWQHFSWVMLNMRSHLGNERDFADWLSTMYLFYFINRLVDPDEGARLLPEIHQRLRELAELQPSS